MSRLCLAQVSLSRRHLRRAPMTHSRKAWIGSVGPETTWTQLVWVDVGAISNVRLEPIIEALVDAIFQFLGDKLHWVLVIVHVG